MGRMTKAALMAAIDDPYIVRIDGSELPHEYVWANWWQRQTGTVMLGYAATFSFASTIDGGDETTTGTPLDRGDETTATEPVIGGFAKMEGD